MRLPWSFGFRSDRKALQRAALSTMAWSLRGNAGWQFVQTVAGTGTELLVLLVFAARLSPLEFGALAVALSAAKVVFLLFEARIHEFLTPKLARYIGRHADAAWQWTLWSRRTEVRLNLLGLAACLVIAAALPVVSDAVSRDLFVAASAYALFNTWMKFSSLSILRCLAEIRVAAALSVVGGAGKLAVLFACLTAGLTTASTLFAMCAPAAATAAALAWLAQRRLRGRLGSPRRRPVHPLRHHNRIRQSRILLSNYATGLIEIGHRELDLQIVAWMAGAGEGGRYRLAKTLAMFMLEALNPIVLVLLPELARRLAWPDRGQLRTFVRRIAALFAGIGLASAVVVASLASAYLHRFAPLQLASWVPMLILLIGFTALSPTLWAQAYLVAAGRPQAYLRGSLAGAVGSAVLAFVLARDLGAAGSAIAHVAGLALTCGVAWVNAREHLAAHAGPNRRMP